MTKQHIALTCAVCVMAWIAFHGGLILFGAMLGGTFLDWHGDKELRCEEDEVAIHGGLDDWYDPGLPLECVNFEEFPNRAFLDGYDNGYRDGFIEGLSKIVVPKTDRVQETEPTPAPIASSTAATPVPTPTPTPRVMQVSLTFYTCPPFCLGDIMANGMPLHDRSVACGYAFDIGQTFEFDGAEYVCEDRGGGPYYWVDLWKPTYEIGAAWQAEVGMTGVVVLTN